jgi:hypothetical protein
MINKVFLLGGFMVNDNYGDVIQARLWTDWYKKQGIDCAFICYEKGKKKCQAKLGLNNNQVLSTNDFLSTEIDDNSMLHLYGGGYLNSMWGDDFLPMIKHSHDCNLKIIATGIQTDAIFYEKSKQFNILFVSVRDEITSKLVGGNPLIIDDSFGYFYKKRPFYNLNRKINSYFPKRKVLLQLSLNNYVFESEDKDLLIARLKDLIVTLKQSNHLVFASSFPSDINGLLENQQLVDNLGLQVKDYTYTSTKNLDASLLDNFQLVIVNSFHTYLALIHKYSCPTFYIAVSKYYQQKARGLINYGVLSEDMLISRPEQLSKLTDSAKRTPVDLNALHSIENSFSNVFDRTSEIINAS